MTPEVRGISRATVIRQVAFVFSIEVSVSSLSQTTVGPDADRFSDFWELLGAHHAVTGPVVQSRLILLTCVCPLRCRHVGTAPWHGQA